MARKRKSAVDAAPRIYNLFPPLVGTTRDWVDHLPRISAMNFDWLYLNPFHEPGFSGSLYAIKDPYRLNPLFDGAGNPDQAIRAFAKASRKHGLGVMMDLVVNHTAKDANLAAEHPDWYRLDLDGSLYSPRVADPDDPDRVTVWGDLAELDYEHPVSRAGLIDYWSDYLVRHLRLGIQGFRCDAAYKVPTEVWRALIGAARAEEPSAVFFAETLGCPMEAVEALADAGFDYFFNSSKWWDFRSDWLLDQYERMRRIAPSIAFPESHDTERAVSELGTDDPERIARHLELRYLFAACFSSGVMMPIGYEYGFTRSLDVVETRPADWEEPKVELCDYIAAVNALKASLPVLNREGPQRRITAPGTFPVALMRRDDSAEADCVLVVLNPDPEGAHEIDPGPLMAETGGRYEGFEDVTPRAEPRGFEPGSPLRLESLEARVFRGVRQGRRGRRRSRAPTARASERQLLVLADERLTIEDVWPEIDGGRHPVKRIVGDVLGVWADIFCDGHDVIAACVKYRPVGERDWRETPMRHFDNDRWYGRIPLSRNTRYEYTIEAWRDLFAGWRRDLNKKRDAGQAIGLELTEGRILVERTLEAAQGRDREILESLLERLEAAGEAEAGRAAILLSDELADVMNRAGIRTNLTRYSKILEVVVDRSAALHGAWYELFPRSMSDDPARHGTFDDVIRHLPYVRELGFDVLYFTPIHPIGKTNRKGRNNTLTPAPDDPGSPYAIGSDEGGHTAIHSELGTLEDFRRLV
ncbi:MAG TPA: maltotransferase domain-containing protein, partial [Kiloniellales bacterium]|nr:maltotransferase domain-containing protein [Kiloniellales bacterium]